MSAGRRLFNQEMAIIQPVNDKPLNFEPVRKHSRFAAVRILFQSFAPAILAVDMIRLARYQLC
jgi:hypothetical protein